MKLKGIAQIFFILSLAIVTTYAFQFLLRWVAPGLFKELQTETTEELKPGQSVPIVSRQEIQRPLDREIVFASQATTGRSILTEVTTHYGSLVFTTATGSLERLDFKKSMGSIERVLTPIAPVVSSDDGSVQDQSSTTMSYARLAFVVGLSYETPFEYSLIDKKELSNEIKLTYKAESIAAVIIKEFIIDRNVPRIDVKLTIEPRGIDQSVQAEQEISPKGLRARIFVPAPYIAAADKQYEPLGFVYNEDKHRLEKQTMQQLVNDYRMSNEKAKSMPEFIGLEDRYFVNAMIYDAGNFAQRAYFIGIKPETLSLILESPVIKESKTWTISFYCGPKEATLMSSVDPRLEQTLDSSWLAPSPIIKLLLRLLMFIFNYVKNYGWAIVLLTLLIRLLMLPLTYKGHKSMEKQKEFQRKMQYIEHKYKDNPEMLNQERVALTKKYGVSNILGCFPQLIQLPILIALNKLLSTSVEMYQAPWFGWITDLSSRDPYYILPLLAGAGLLIQISSDMDAKRGVTMLLFAALLVAVTANLAAGVTLYLCVNTWLSLAQIYAQKKLRL